MWCMNICNTCDGCFFGTVTLTTLLTNTTLTKWKTIGDAYMIASGLPELNGLKHAGKHNNIVVSWFA